MAKQNQYEIRGETAVVFCPCPDGTEREVLCDADLLPEILAVGFWRVYDRSQTPRSPLFHCLATVNQKTIFMHRVVSKPSPGLVVDHWNHDGLDNRRANLRNVTHSENLLNQATRPGRGVVQRGHRFESKVKLNQKYIYLGRFDTREEASATVHAFLRAQGANV